MLPDVNQSDLLDLLRKGLLIRRFEESLIKLARVHAVGHFHVYIGQEITGVAALSLLQAGDLCFTTHRNHGHLLARGADPGRMLAEILGKETGYCRGRGGTLHIASLQHGFPTTSSAVGGCTPLATGAAFAMKKLGVDRVSVCLFGDGALEEGSWHESANIAALEKLPVIFLCENNSLQALGQKAGEYPSSTLAATRLTDLADVFKIPAVAVDGVDADAVHRAMHEGIARARAGDGPTFIEACTVRWPGNRPLWPELLTGETNLAMAWSEDLIPSEFRSWHAADDGLLRLVRELLAAGHSDRAKVLDLDAQIRAQVEAAGSFALESEYPAPESALELVYANAGAGQ
jgi:TPP-dependent pyruvate/acetoin dehydrogenase alpha subunit